MKRNQLFSHYPIFLNVWGKKCVVVGGGAVALRKTEALLKHGAQVEVISPVLCSKLNQLVEKKAICWRQKDYHAGDLEGALLAVAATDDIETNERVAKGARQEKILVNVADNLQSSDFIIPSYFNRGDITIAVSTSGKSPALARKLRSQLEEELGDEYALLASMVGEVRSTLNQSGVSVDGNTWQKALDMDSLLDLLRAGRDQEARDVLVNNLKVQEQSKP
ncbi:MAG: bifunctional precorrin-2 dehydrogenase/sirohydrochlorin ferrochelatase [Dehalococcoidia bacterium]|nr:bifunctional precorrin-2 dehydrogenase/sirohydrochlorin ferrochelatase [Dehalococcoidia bacterium]